VIDVPIAVVPPEVIAGRAPLDSVHGVAQLSSEGSNEERVHVMTALRIALGCGVLLALAVAGQAEARNSPPACAAISFRPLPQGAQEGTQDAGMYRSRFGKIVLKGEVTGGQPQNYYIEVNGKRPELLKGSLPATVNPCLNSKHVKTPVPAIGDKCVGDRFRVVIDHQGKQEYIMLFGLQGDAWKQCSASAL
jgi:hypothetical protein